MSTPVVSAANKLKKIRESYVKQLPVQLETIRISFKEFSGKTSSADGLEKLHRQIHTLKGSSASFGLTRLSAVLSSAEDLAKEAMRTEEPLGASWFDEMRKCLEQMEQEAVFVDYSKTTDYNALDLVVASENAATREKKFIYLCEDDAFQRVSLSTQISCFGFQVTAFGDLDQLCQAVKHSTPDAIVMDLMFPGEPLGGASKISSIQAERDIPIPVVFISSQDQFSSRLAAVRAGSNAYFVKPVNATELCETLSKLTTVEQPEPYRILIIDDDIYLADAYSVILQGEGMLTCTVNDPLQAMSQLLEFKPDLILTDMHMPGCNGMELAKVIRQMNSYLSIPIIFLSSETDIDKQFHAMRTGGDEFLTKPIKPEHLVSAVAVRAERMKIVRSFMIRDAMTGLFNYSTTKEHLETAVSEAKRSGKELCCAMIDVDRFKQVNDTYGHPTGDRVIIALASLLQRRLRKTDIIGRYGGEEFAVILADCGVSTAVELLEELRKSFSEIQFPSCGAFFACTFSCGIASLSQNGDAASILKAADVALYEAKAQGRNRLVVAGE